MAPRAPPKPLLNSMVDSLPRNEESFFSRLRVTSVIPERSGEPQAPVPYLSRAALAAATVSGWRARPR